MPTPRTGAALFGLLGLALTATGIMGLILVIPKIAMTLLPEQEDQIRRYLLGVAMPDEVEWVETDLLRGDENVEHLLLIEDELIADYALDALSEHERDLLEKDFFSTPERREKLMIAHEMVKQASAHGKAEMPDQR